MNDSDTFPFWAYAVWIILSVAALTGTFFYELGKKHGRKEVERESFEFEDIAYNQELLEELELQVKHQKEHIQRIKGEPLKFPSDQ
jgi:hypothetical protein